MKKKKHIIASILLTLCSIHVADIATHLIIEFIDDQIEHVHLSPDHEPIHLEGEDNVIQEYVVPDKFITDLLTSTKMLPVLSSDHLFFEHSVQVPPPDLNI